MASSKDNEFSCISWSTRCCQTSFVLDGSIFKVLRNLSFQLLFPGSENFLKERWCCWWTSHKNIFYSVHLAILQVHNKLRKKGKWTMEITLSIATNKQKYAFQNLWFIDEVNSLKMMIHQCAIEKNIFAQLHHFHACPFYRPDVFTFLDLCGQLALKSL